MVKKFESKLAVNPEGTYKPPSLARPAMLMLLAISVALRLSRLGAKSIWLDESFRMAIASLAWHDFLRAAVRPFGANSLAFHLVLRYWLVLGRDEAVVRALSVIFGVGIVLATYKLGVILFDELTGLIAASFVATNAILVQYAQEVCAYTLAALLAVVASLYLLRGLSKNKRADWIAYSVTSTMMVYCHVLSFLVVVANAIAVFLSSKGKTSYQAIVALASVTAAFLLLASVIVFAPPQAKVWLAPPGLHELVLLLGYLGGPGGLALGFLFLLFATLSFRYVSDSQMTVGGAKWRCIFLFLWALLPPTLLFLLSQWKPLFLPRYLLPSVPPLLLLAAASIRRLKHKHLAAVCSAAVLLFSLATTALYLYNRNDAQHTDDWRDATAFLIREARGGDAVVFYYRYERFPFRYYLDRCSHAGFSAHIIPEGDDEALLEEPPDAIETGVSAISPKSYRRVWLVYSAALAASNYGQLSGLPIFYRQLTQKFQTSSHYNFGNIRLILFADAKHISE